MRPTTPYSFYVGFTCVLVLHRICHRDRVDRRAIPYDNILDSSELGHNGLASGHMDLYQLFQSEWKPKYSESPLKSVSEGSPICLLTPNTSQDTAI